VNDRSLLTLVDDALEADDGEQTAAHSCARDQAQDDDPEQASSIGAGDLLQEGVSLCSSHVDERGGGSGKVVAVARKAASRSSSKAPCYKVAFAIHRR
jgi:hypothetical protein